MPSSTQSSSVETPTSGAYLDSGLQHLGLQFPAGWSHVSVPVSAEPTHSTGLATLASSLSLSLPNSNVGSMLLAGDEATPASSVSQGFLGAPSLATKRTAANGSTSTVSLDDLSSRSSQTSPPMLTEDMVPATSGSHSLGIPETSTPMSSGSFWSLKGRTLSSNPSFVSLESTEATPIPGGSPMEQAPAQDVQSSTLFSELECEVLGFRAVIAAQQYIIRSRALARSKAQEGWKGQKVTSVAIVDGASIERSLGMHITPDKLGRRLVAMKNEAMAKGYHLVLVVPSIWLHLADERFGEKGMPDSKNPLFQPVGEALRCSLAWALKDDHYVTVVPVPSTLNPSIIAASLAMKSAIPLIANEMASHLADALRHATTVHPFRFSSPPGSHELVWEISNLVQLSPGAEPSIPTGNIARDSKIESFDLAPEDPMLGVGGRRLRKVNLCRHYVNGRADHPGRSCHFIHPCMRLITTGSCSHAGCLEDHICVEQLRMGRCQNTSACPYLHVPKRVLSEVTSMAASAPKAPVPSPGASRGPGWVVMGPTSPPPSTPSPASPPPSLPVLTPELLAAAAYYSSTSRGKSCPSFLLSSLVLSLSHLTLSRGSTLIWEHLSASPCSAIGPYCQGWHSPMADSVTNGGWFAS